MGFVKKYILGWGIGLSAAAYGLIAMLTGRTFLPGLQRDALTLGGRGGLALALAYLSGGVFLFMRQFLETRSKTRRSQITLYMAENALLIVFIAALIYVLVRVDSVT